MDSLEVEKIVVRDVDTDAEIEPSISAEIINGPKLGHNSALISKFDNQIWNILDLKNVGSYEFRALKKFVVQKIIYQKNIGRKKLRLKIGALIIFWSTKFWVKKRLCP